jgi:cytochrome c oxidase cbb3-type subunit 3
MITARNVRIAIAALIAYGLAVFVFACQPRSADETPALSPAVTDSVAAAAVTARLDRGKQAYLGYCAMCHGEWGGGDGPLAAEMQKQGTGPAVLNLKERLRQIGRREVVEVIVKGGGHTGRSNLMPPWGEKLDTRLIGEIADFVITLPDVKPGPTTDVIEQYLKAPPGAPDEGRRLFVFYCTACHGPEGRGDGTFADSLFARNQIRPRNLTDAAYFSQRSDSDLYSTIALGGGHMGRSVYMPAWTASFAPAQINDLVAYVRVISGTPAQK